MDTNLKGHDKNPSDILVHLKLIAQLHGEFV
jgi:hypothetical protein